MNELSQTPQNIKARDYYALNADRIREKAREFQRKYRELYPERFILAGKLKIKKPQNRFHQYQADAQKRGISFELTFEEFMEFWQKPCFYCEDVLVTVGLDRVDNTLGYTKDNVVSACKYCNMMKKALTFGDFIGRCKQIARRHGG